MSSVAYVSNADSGSISVLALDDTTGALHTVQELPLGGQLMPQAVAPDGRFLFVARRSAPLAVLSLAVAPGSGQLRLLGEAALPASMAHIATDASGRWLLCASYHDGLVAVCGIGSDGLVQPAHQVVATGPKTHAIRCLPGDGGHGAHTHTLTCVLGHDRVLRHGFDARRGRLRALHEAVAIAPGSGPRHLALHPAGRWAWVLGELDANITTLDLQSDMLRAQRCASAWPAGQAGTPWAADLRLSPDGRFVYASERTHSSLHAFAVDGRDGSLQPVGHWPTEAQPRGFAISPNGRWLVCAGQRSHHVAVYGIDRATGLLQAAGRCAVGQNPNWVEIVDPTAAA